ncbi:uncharacterized protein [Anabrus simplex]|uniref:uncharacterized protein n=1 Tax=Anabrus simplex TaxID=316456 RepID=UPI0035A3620A
MDVDSVDYDISNPEVIEEEFNALAGLTDGENSHENINTENSTCFKTSYKEDLSYDNTDLTMTDTYNERKIISDISEKNDEDRIASNNKIHDTPVKMRVTHWKQYWDAKMADQKRKDEGKPSGPQKTIKKFTSQYLKSCNTSTSQPRKRCSPSIRIPGIVNKWRKTFEDSISVNDDSNEQALLRSNRIAKQWHNFFEYGSSTITPTQCSNDGQLESVISKEIQEESETTKPSMNARSKLISSNEDSIQFESVSPYLKKEIAEAVPEVEKPGFTLQLFSPLPVITSNHVTQRKISFEKEALEATRPTVTSKVLQLQTSNSVAKCKQFWDSIGKEEHTSKPLPKMNSSPQIRTNLSSVVHTPSQIESGTAQVQSSARSVFGSGGRHVDVQDGLYRARPVAVCSDIELSSGVSTPGGQETTCHNTILAVVEESEQHDEDSDKVQPPHRTKEIKKSETPDTRARFQSAKLFFQILERSTSTAPKPPVGPFSYASSTDFDETESECGDESQRRQRRKRRQKVFSEPTSDTETLSRLTGLRRRGVGALVGGSDRLPRRKVSERFHVKDLFRDVAGGGIPHREAVLAALRSVDNSRPVSPYDEQEELEPPVSPGPQVYHTEYPHLPATPACHFRPRDMLQRGTFMTRRDLINMQ